MKKAILYYCANGALVAAMAAQPAVAQTASTDTRPAAASASAQGDQAIQEVIVTAQRFSESVQKTPLAITVLNSQQLQAVNEVGQLQTIAPGVAIGAAGQVTQTFIRGIGSLNAVPAAESSVSYNEDGVVLFSSSMITPLFFDLDRVEVLMGPQGTLYGRNASGGAINLITRGATLGDFNGYIEGEYGNFNLGRVTAAVNIPVSDTLAVRLAGEHVGHDGYLSDGSDDQNQNAGRVRVLWQPTPTVTLRAGLDVASADSKGYETSVTPNPTSDKWIGGRDPRLQRGATAVYPPNFQPPYFHDNQWSIYGQLDADLEFATLTVLPSYRNERVHYLDYPVAAYDGQIANTEQTSVEARLAHQNDRLKWVAGAFYLNVDQFSVSFVNQDPTTNLTAVNPSKTKSYAFFGETTYSVLDSTRIIAGLRWTHESRISSGTVVNAPSVGTGFSYGINNRASAKALTWKFGIEQDLTSDSMLFFTASRGFKGGGAYIDNPAINPNSSFKPEFVTAYEFGSRNQFFNHTLQLNAEAFYWKLSNQQVTYLGFNPAAQLSLITVNAGKAHMAGASVDATWRATPDDTIHVGVQYEHSRYDAFSRTILYGLSVPATTICKQTGVPIPGVNPTGALVPFLPAVDECAGQPLPRAPEWAGSASYQHRFNLGTAGDFLFDVDTTFATATYMDPTFTAIYRQPTYALLNTSLTYTPPNLAISVTAWVRNLADTRVFNGGVQTDPTYAHVTLMPPQTYGITARYSF